MPTKIAVVSVTADSSDVTKVVDFYSKLLGMEFVRSLSNELSFHVPFNSEGHQFTVNQRHRPEEDVMIYWHVDNLEEAIRTAEQNGGKLTAQPFDLPVASEGQQLLRNNFPTLPNEAVDSLGRAAHIEDPAGNRIGLIQFQEWSQRLFRVDTPIAENIQAEHRRAIQEGRIFMRQKQP